MSDCLSLQNICQIGSWGGGSKEKESEKEEEGARKREGNGERVGILLGRQICRGASVNLQPVKCTTQVRDAAREQFSQEFMRDPLSLVAALPGFPALLRVW